MWSRPNPDPASLPSTAPRSLPVAPSTDSAPRAHRRCSRRRAQRRPHATERSVRVGINLVGASGLGQLPGVALGAGARIRVELAISAADRAGRERLRPRPPEHAGGAAVTGQSELQSDGFVFARGLPLASGGVSLGPRDCAPAPRPDVLRVQAAGRSRAGAQRSGPAIRSSNLRRQRRVASAGSRSTAATARLSLSALAAAAGSAVTHYQSPDGNQRHGCFALTQDSRGVLKSAWATGLSSTIRNRPPSLNPDGGPCPGSVLAEHESQVCLARPRSRRAEHGRRAQLRGRVGVHTAATSSACCAGSGSRLPTSRTSRKRFSPCTPSFLRSKGARSSRRGCAAFCLRKTAEYRRKAYRRRELPTSAEPESMHAEATARMKERCCASNALQQLLAALPQSAGRAARGVRALRDRGVAHAGSRARALGCPRFTAYTRLRTARAAVRAFFEREPQRRMR